MIQVVTRALSAQSIEAEFAEAGLFRENSASGNSASVLRRSRRPPFGDRPEVAAV